MGAGEESSGGKHGRTVREASLGIDELRRLLDAEIDRQIGPQRGCWPLVVGVAGVLLGLALLAGLL